MTPSAVAAVSNAFSRDSLRASWLLPLILLQHVCTACAGAPRMDSHYNRRASAR
jgi:hypothetical protein